MIAVIALLTRILNAVATERAFGRAGAGAPVPCDQIPVITLLAGVENVVPASRFHCAIAVAAVAAPRVSVITFLIILADAVSADGAIHDDVIFVPAKWRTPVPRRSIPIITLLCRSKEEAVAAARERTGSGARVRIHRVLIIAFLAPPLSVRGLDGAIAAARDLARCGADIVSYSDPVVTFLSACRPEEAVTARATLAFIGTGIGLDGISIIALLFISKPVWILDDDIATEREGAGPGAEIRITGISIITLFPCIELSVPTVCIRFELTGCGTTIARDNVPIIALLAVHRLKNAVTAAWKHLDHARGRTIVAVCRIAIIALFARLDSSIPADGRFGLTERVASISGSRIPVITLL